MDAQRNEALYRQRMAQSNAQLSNSNPPPQQRAQFDPRVPRPPHMSAAVPRPPPPGAPRSVKRITGSGRKISRGFDPADSYHNSKNKESLVADASEGDGVGMLSGINQLVVGVLLVLAFASIFVLPKQLKVFWVMLLGLTILMQLGMQLYKEWIFVGQKGGEDAKYAEWASMLLYTMVMLYSSVMTGILFFMAWSLYSIANSKTNIARLDKQVLADSGPVEGGGDYSSRKRNKVYV